MSGKRTILIVDDEPQIMRALRAGLVGRGYEVSTATDGRSALEQFRRRPPDLVVADLSMPGMDGAALCRAIRAESDVPLIVLSVRGEERVKVESLDAGADDYVTKPFGMDELLARVRAALRRSAPRRSSSDTTPAPGVAAADGASASDSTVAPGAVAPGAAAPGAAVIDVGDFRVDVEGHTASVAGRSVRLTPKEFDLLVFFAKNWGRVVTHEAVLGAVWGLAYARQVEYLRVFVGQLRKKIEPEPACPRYILTEPWIGYRFDPGG